MHHSAVWSYVGAWGKRKYVDSAFDRSKLINQFLQNLLLILNWENCHVWPFLLNKRQSKIILISFSLIKITINYFVPNM